MTKRKGAWDALEPQPRLHYHINPHSRDELIAKMIDNSDSNKFCGSKFYSKSLSLLIPILEMINQGFILKQIADTLDIKQPHVSYYIRKAKELGYITKTVRDRIKIIKLTQPGINFLDQYNNKAHNKRGASCRAENIRFKARVYRLPSKTPDWDRVKMNNWSQYKSRVDDIKVRLNMGKSPTIEFLPSPLDGKSHDELYGILHDECTEAAKKVEQTLDMEIGRLELEPGPEWVAYDPVARTICKSNGQVTIEGVGKINASKPLRRGEIEYFDLRQAADYFAMPRRLLRIEKMVEELLKSRHTTNYDVPIE